MKFTPEKPGPSRTAHYIRVDVKDWARIEKIAKQRDVGTAEIVRQAIHFALENMS